MRKTLEDEYSSLDAIAIATGIREKYFSVREITSIAVNKAKKVNPKVNAIVACEYEKAIARADTINIKSSNLAGVPFLIKDLTPYHGLPVRYGSRTTSSDSNVQDAEIVKHYIKAGLNILGKTNTPERGLTITTEPKSSGPCHNPWNLDYSTGGSSGGAAAAVAAGIVPAAHATDGGGSIRIPSSCCGLFGLKPSRGLTITQHNLAECWSGLSVGNVVSRTVRDSAAFLDLIRRHTSSLFPLPLPINNDTKSRNYFYDNLNNKFGEIKIAVVKTHPTGEKIQPEVLSAIDSMANQCSELGHHIEEIEHPVDHSPVADAASRIISTHIYQSVHEQFKNFESDLDASQLELGTKIMAKRGRKVSADEYVRARDTMTLAEITMQKFHNKYDILLSPVLTSPPVKLGWLNMDCHNTKEYAERFNQYSGFCALYNATGAASMSVPAAVSADKLPIGALFSACNGNDLLLLQLASQLEHAFPWNLVAPI
jgi:Asp-tRNA(Asn)/Glu-tRNA(Gln) amidotransferase A subunit family amidase